MLSEFTKAGSWLNRISVLQAGKEESSFSTVEGIVERRQDGPHHGQNGQHLNLNFQAPEP